MKLLILREPYPYATPGRLSVDGVIECDTLELPWLDNQNQISCIPPGVYGLAWEPSPRLKRNTLRVKGVPGRWGILIHPANHVAELKGCIALGKRFAVDEVMESKPAIEAVEAKVRAALDWGEVVTLEIRNAV
jgi:hypothetical protein